MDRVTLAVNPDWHTAAQELVAGLTSLGDAAERVELLERICTGLGDALYPAFLQILHIVDTHGEPPARRLVAGVLVGCLVSGRLPEGKLAAWGAIAPHGDTAFGQVRRLGPIEFACAWYSQSIFPEPLSRRQFVSMLTSLLSLTGSHPAAHRLYRQKLESDIDDPIGGCLSGRTRHALAALVDTWQYGADSHRVAEAFLDALQQHSALKSIAQPRPGI